MSLNYYYADVVNADEVMFTAGYMRPDSQSIIFATMAVGMGSITDKTLVEFCARLRLLEKIHGWNPISPRRIKEHIGLSTNVNYEPRGTWLKRYMNYELDDLSQEVRRELECATSSVS